MSIAEDVATTLSQGERSQGSHFEEQLKAYEEFRKRMEAAGVAPRKQEFRIPLIERIGTFRFSS